MMRYDYGVYTIDKTTISVVGILTLFRVTEPYEAEALLEEGLPEVAKWKGIPLSDLHVVHRDTFGVFRAAFEAAPRIGVARLEGSGRAVLDPYINQEA